MLALTILVCPSAMADEATFDGKPVRYWVSALSDSDARARAEAAKALGRIGPDASSAVRPLMKAARDPDEYVRGCAIYSLGKIGPQAKPAIPVLIEALADYKLAAVASQSLGWIGKDSVPALKKLKKHPNDRARIAATRALARIGKPAVRSLIAFLQDNDYRVRSAAAAALGNVGPEAEEAVPALLKCAAERPPSRRNDFGGGKTRTHHRFRYAAVWSLGRIRPTSERAIKKLRGFLSDEHVWNAAAFALGNIGPKAATAVPDLLRLFSDSKRRSSAQSAVAKIGVSAVVPLTELLKADDARVREAAVQTLGRIGPDASAAVPALTAAVNDPNPLVARSAEAVLLARSSVFGGLGASEHARPEIIGDLIPSPVATRFFGFPAVIRPPI